MTYPCCVFCNAHILMLQLLCHFHSLVHFRIQPSGSSSGYALCELSGFLMMWVEWNGSCHVLSCLIFVGMLVWMCLLSEGCSVCLFGSEMIISFTINDFMVNDNNFRTN